MSQTAVAQAIKPAQRPAAQVGGVMQRKCDSCRKKKKPILQRSAIGSTPELVPPIVHEVLRSPGEPLDRGTRAFMEPRFGHDFSQVRVHTDDKAAESADAVSALAYTVQKHIVFGAGQYDPQSVYGQKLFAHELVHTIQQNARGNSISTSQELSIKEPNSASESEAEMASRMIAQGQPRSIPFKAQQITGSTAIQRAIAFRRPTEDGTSREARAQIDRAQEALNAPNIAPGARRELQTRIDEAEAALSSYRSTIDSSSLGMNPVLATTRTGTYGDALVYAVAGLVMLGAWIFSSNASRTSANREAADPLAQALRRLAEAARYARPQPAPPRPEAPPREVPAPRPPGEVIPIETHPRFTPRGQPGPRPEPPRTQQLGPDIFPVPRSEPLPERPRPRRRNNCFEQNPTFTHCSEGYRDIYEVAADFLSIQNEISNVDFRNLRGCRGRTSFGPNEIVDCDMGPGENWHCQVYGAPRPLSIFGCFCCEEDGTTSRVWRGAHWSRGS